ncbi:MAG: hypothetical protein KGP29_06105 [Proteobacteria bacterium]|nr:hypothetical protein [Pseudomonadota bacterium]
MPENPQEHFNLNSSFVSDDQHSHDELTAHKLGEASKTPIQDMLLELDGITEYHKELRNPNLTSLNVDEPGQERKDSTKTSDGEENGSNTSGGLLGGLFNFLVKAFEYLPVGMSKDTPVEVRQDSQSNGASEVANKADQDYQQQGAVSSALTPESSHSTSTSHRSSTSTSTATASSSDIGETGTGVGNSDPEKEERTPEERIKAAIEKCKNSTEKMKQIGVILDKYAKDFENDKEVQGLVEFGKKQIEEIEKERGVADPEKSKKADRQKPEEKIGDIAGMDGVVEGMKEGGITDAESGATPGKSGSINTGIAAKIAHEQEGR